MIVEQMLNNAKTPLLHIADVSGSALFNADCMDILPLIPPLPVNQTGYLSTVKTIIRHYRRIPVNNSIRRHLSTYHTTSTNDRTISNTARPYNSDVRTNPHIIPNADLIVNRITATVLNEKLP